MKLSTRGIAAASLVSLTAIAALCIVAASSPAARADAAVVPLATATPIPLPTPAAKSKHTPNPNEHHGKVTAVSAASITIHNKKDGDQTFAVTADTKVKVAKEKATITDVTVGMEAAVLSADGKTAVKIHAHEPKPHAKKA